VKHRLWPLDPRTYERHRLHRGDRVWPESNCYIDLWIELLHAAGADPHAVLACSLAVDVEGDQWTFFKFPAADLEALYGMTLIELNVWRPLVYHVADQIDRGRAVIVDVDAFYLPDTSGTSYHSEHVKTSIGIQALDLGGRRLGYFHNAGYYELAGDDFTRLFRLEGRLAESEHLPPYAEIVKLGHRPALAGAALHEASLALLGAHLARRPAVNPFRSFATRFACDLQSLVGERLSGFHAYAFATLRQCGAAFELAGAYLRWLEAGGPCGFEPAADACGRIAEAAKALQFKTARAVNARKPLEWAPLLETMAADWDLTMHVLLDGCGSVSPVEG
jgi:hypothetical protein